MVPGFNSKVTVTRTLLHNLNRKRDRLGLVVGHGRERSPMQQIIPLLAELRAKPLDLQRRGGARLPCSDPSIAAHNCKAGK